MIHLYASAMDHPAAVCGANQAWGGAETCVYPLDRDKVTCAGCRAWMSAHRQTRSRPTDVLNIDGQASIG